MSPTTLTHATLRPAAVPTLYFVGVTTGKSSIRQVFPRWATALDLGTIELVGIDMELHAPTEQYRAVVEFIKHDPLSLGALITTHKLDMYAAAQDLFDEVDALAALMGELSCLSKRDGRLLAHAKDPISAGFSLDAIIPQHHWKRTGADVCLLGAGGSAIAIDWYLSRPERGGDVPQRVIVTNRSEPRLHALAHVHQASGCVTDLFTRHTPQPADNDTVVAALAPHSIVINATGLGKDAPGSPLTDAVTFPQGAMVWDLNYRGDLVFLDQARAQERKRDLTVVDGWDYFIHGWTQVIGEVFDVAIPTEGPLFDELSALAAQVRDGRHS